MKKLKKFAIITAVVLIIIIYHFYSTSLCFYEIDYPKENISEVLKKTELSNEDYMFIFEQTGLSPGVVKKYIQKGDFEFLEKMNDLYFEKPEIEKDYIAYPVTVSEANKSFSVPMADIKNGDILVTFNTHTLDWRHGHCAIVTDAQKGRLLEHMSIGNTSCITSIKGWSKYPGFVVLRYPDESVALKAADYAKNNLVDLGYNLFAGIMQKDKTGQQNPSSQCAHIVWQAYKSAGVDIDDGGSTIVIPEDIALSEKLKVVQIYGINPEKYINRLANTN